MFPHHGWYSSQYWAPTNPPHPPSAPLHHHAPQPGPGFNPNYYHHFRRRGPSRVFWFVMGGLSVAWWMKAKDAKKNFNWNEEEWDRKRLAWADRRKQCEETKSSLERSATSAAESTVDSAMNALSDLKAKLAKRRELQDNDEPRIV